MVNVAQRVVSLQTHVFPLCTVTENNVSFHKQNAHRLYMYTKKMNMAYFCFVSFDSRIFNWYNVCIQFKIG